MAVRSYVVQESLSGSSSDDITCDVYQMSLNDRYAISDPVSLIADDIYTSISDIIDMRYSVRHIRKILRDGAKSKGLLGYDSDKASVILHADKDNKVYYYDIVNNKNFKFRKVYRVQDIDDEKVGYLVVEYIPYDNGKKYAKRCYSPYFKTLEDADAYLDKISDNCDNIENFRISVANIDDLKKSEWYSRNISLFDTIIRYKLDPNKYRDIIDLDVLEDKLKADTYEFLSDHEQAVIDVEIYQRIYDFIPDERAYMLDMDLNGADDDEKSYITDAAIAVSLAQASSAAEFKAIYDALGPFDWRIGGLTDDIYNDHPDEGYILVSADGEIRWYKNCYFLNEWEGARDTPYFGKFQKNICDTLLCFKEYHPELIVDLFPSEELLADYEHRYIDTISQERNKHSEMYFYIDDDGDEIVVGDWYYNGVASDDLVPDVAFMRVHNHHTFTEDECRAILSGEEVVIDNFKTKSGIVTTIRGKLRSVSGTYDENTMVEFIRTDLDSGKRKKINNELGIVEPGVASYQSV